MGSHISCVSSKVDVPHNIVKVIALYGEVIEFQRAMKAAEVMLDNPQHFVCHATSLQTGHRIIALSADEELELGHLYFLLPMQKLYSSLSTAEMASLAFKADLVVHKSSSHHNSLVRIFPVLGDLCMFHAERKLDAVNDGNELNGEINSAKVEGPEPKNNVMQKLRVGDAYDIREMREINMRFTRRRYWKPMLDTITESPS